MVRLDNSFSNVSACVADSKTGGVVAAAADDAFTTIGTSIIPTTTINARTETRSLKFTRPPQGRT